MNKLFVLIFLITLTAQAATEKMTATAMMGKIDTGNISFEIEPAVRRLAIATLMKIGDIKDPRQLSEKLVMGTEQSIVRQFQQQYIYFQPAMANVKYIQDTSWRYSITFDFMTTRKCTFRAERIDSACGNPVCSYSEEDISKHPNVDVKGTIIPDKYCEKIYSIKIQPQGNLNKDTIGVENEK